VVVLVFAARSGYQRKSRSALIRTDAVRHPIS